MTVLGDRLQDRSANNLDFLRCLAAGMVIFSHCFPLLGFGPDPLERWSGRQNFGALGLQLFFFMSGMLVTSSWCHTPSVPVFVRRRVLRIFPGLVVAAFFCTFVVGPLGTVFEVGKYFSYAHTYFFLLNGVLPTVSYYLPGVFLLNPSCAVNGSLWTLPYELGCYLVVLICGKLRLLTPQAFPLTGAVLLALIPVRRLLSGGTFLTNGQFHLDSLEPCLIEFLLGMAAFLYRHRLPMDRRLAWLALGIYLSTLAVGLLGQCVALLLVPYLVLYTAQVRVAGFHRFARYGDLSYGMYIYAFPVQQLFVHTFDTGIGVTGLFLLSTALTAGLAYFSWHLVEHPASTLRWRRWRRFPKPVAVVVGTAA